MRTTIAFCRIFALSCLLPGAAAFAQEATAEWIWHRADNAAQPEADVAYFRKEFVLDSNVAESELTVMGDDEGMIFVNGDLVANEPAWIGPGFKAQRKEVHSLLKRGRNVIAARVENATVSAGLIAKLELRLEGDKRQTLVTDTTWLASTNSAPGWNELDFNAAGWRSAVSIGKHGIQPWGDILYTHRATAGEALELLPGFTAQLLRSAQPGEGSWICMAVDPRGRLIISPQERPSPSDGGLLRVTLTAAGELDKIERLETPIGVAMGMLYAFDSLYVSGQGPEGTGLYRLRDTNGDDQFDRVELLKLFDKGTGEHGAHAIVLGRDEKLYLIHGNSTALPNGLEETSPFRHYAEDDLLPRTDDPVATFFEGIKSPYGYVLRTDRDGREWELISGGLRNPYDFDFNADGDLFAFDSDMEWDVGLPWYRPTRILHIVSGAEYGFREGSSKWPEYYPDSLPAAVNVGLSSPTGVKFGTKSSFPAKYQKALFAMDWSYGRILAVHLQPRGASYSADFETFVSGKPLPVTDLEFGADGAMYFVTGGRGTQSGLYRVAYSGAERVGKFENEQARSDDASKARALRSKLESFHTRAESRAVDFAWPHLGSSDRFIQFAARVAVENQAAATWHRRALAESNTDAGLIALLAVVRTSERGMQDDVLRALEKFPAGRLNTEQLLTKIRVLTLSYVRQGAPNASAAARAIAEFDPLFPSAHESVNRELAQLMVYLKVPSAIEDILQLMATAPTQEGQIHYARVLRHAKTEWSLEQRERYFKWFNRAQTEFKGGNSFGKYLERIRKDAITSLTDSERQALSGLIEHQAARETVSAPQRPFVADWKMEDLEAALERAGRNRSFEKGKAAFADAQCLSCHRFGNEGGSVGPDLTGASGRFNRRDLLEAILLPSKVVSDQYLNTTFVKKDTTEYTGLVVDEDAEKIVVLVNPLAQQRVEILKSDIEERIPSKISPMPEGLVNVLTESEILDLIAYIESAGNRTHPVFGKEAR